MNNPFNQTLTFILKIRPFRVFDLKKRYDSSNSNKVFNRNQILSIQTWNIPMVFFASSHFAVESQLRTFTSGNFALSHLRPKGVRGSNETPCLPMPFVRVWNYHHKNILELTVSAWYLLWLDWLQVYFLSGCIKYYIYLVLNIFSHKFLRSPSVFIQRPTEPKVKQFNQSWVFALLEHVIIRPLFLMGRENQ